MSPTADDIATLEAFAANLHNAPLRDRFKPRQQDVPPTESQTSDPEQPPAPTKAAPEPEATKAAPSSMAARLAALKAGKAA